VGLLISLGLGPTLLSACGTGQSAGSPAATLERAVQLQRGGHLADAQQLYNTVLSAQPNNVYALYDLGSIEQAQGQTTQALNHYAKALQQNPQYVPALYSEAVIYAAGDPVLAITLYRQIVQLDPTQAGAQLSLGLLEASRGHRAKGIKDLAAATASDPSLAARVPRKLRSAVKAARSGAATPTAAAAAGQPTATP